MVICIIALAVFGILGIFSAKYRKLAKEAFDCVFRMVTLRPCVTKLDERIRSKVTAKLMRVPAVAKFFYKNFKILSWVFTISFFASMIYSAYGIYNLVVYGNCQPGSNSVCVINQGANQIAQNANQIIQILTCFEAQIVYGIIIAVVLAVLAVKYLKIKRK